MSILADLLDEKYDSMLAHGSLTSCNALVKLVFVYNNQLKLCMIVMNRFAASPIHLVHNATGYHLMKRLFVP